jgi:hypothetical protein
MPKPQNDTRSALVAIKDGKSQRATCAALGLDDSWRGTIHRIIHRIDVGTDKENEVRLRLGLPVLSPTLVPVPACPDCGSVHHARCNGHAGAVVVLAPGETVTTPRGPWQSKARPEVAAMVAGLEACLARKAGHGPGAEVYRDQ